MSNSATTQEEANDSPPAYRRLKQLWAEIHDVEAIQELLDWDQETYMPKGGQEPRAKMCGTLASLRHRMLCSEELWQVIGECTENAEADGDGTGDGTDIAATQAWWAQRIAGRARKLPEALTRALAEARSRGTATWQEARKRSDFGIFHDSLDELVRLTREEADALSDGGRPYDALLDKYEPGVTEAHLVPLFEHMVSELVPLLGRIVESGHSVDESPVLGTFEAGAQRTLALHAASSLGFDLDAGRLDATSHPFCVGIAPTDVRLTWRWQDDDLRPGLYGVLHEAGHGLYEQGLPREHWRTPVGEAVSLGIHESQSRLIENQVGRSRGFWRFLLPTFHELFPGARHVDVDTLWPTLHVVRPSLIRVEADETTYNLHVAARFELERAIFAGDLEVADLPAAWHEQYRQLLGISADNDAEGVLQDIHWSQGIFGYFPTYTLGSMNAAQLFEAAEAAIGPLDDAFAAGDFAPLLDWLRQNIHRHGSRYMATELIERATGTPPSAAPLIAYLERQAAAIYGV